MRSAAGALIEETLDMYGLSQRTAAVEIGISQPHLNALLSGHRSLTPTVAVCIEEALGISANKLLQLQLQDQLAATLKRRKTKGARKKWNSSGGSSSTSTLRLVPSRKPSAASKER